MSIINYADYSLNESLPAVSGRKIYKKASFLYRITKKFHLKEIFLTIAGFLYVYMLFILCFACCQW